MKNLIESRRGVAGRRLAIAAAFLLLLPFPASAQGDGMEGSVTYQQFVDSVLLVAAMPKGKVNETKGGTGVLIDAEHGYVLTSRHVIREGEAVAACFPARDREGEIIGKTAHYVTNAKSLSIPCEVVAQDQKCDLALLRLKSPPPPAARAIPIAVRSARPGGLCCIIGNSGMEDAALWRFAGGSVRQVYTDRFRLEKAGYSVEARIAETTVAFNEGDSGGPILNPYGELIGIVMGDVPKLNQVSAGVDVSEVWSFLRKPGRSLNVTLFDRGHSVLDERNKIYHYVTVSLVGLDPKSETVGGYRIAVYADGRATVSPITVGLAGK